MTANERQIGGDHYKTKYEHWDLVLNTGMGYLEGCATKYVARWRKKGGLADLRKALHYVEKIQENEETLRTRQRYPQSVNTLTLANEAVDFSLANDLQAMELLTVGLLVNWSDDDNLAQAAARIKKLILDNPDPVPLTEENMHAQEN